MPKDAIPLDRKAVRPVGKKPHGKEVGSFIVLIFSALVLLLIIYLLGYISEMLLLVGIVIILFFIQSSVPPFIIELEQYERAVLLRYGKFLKVAGPGWVTLIPFIDDARIVDMRVMVVDKEFSPQEVLTKDNILLKVDAIMYMKVTDPKAAVINVKDPIEAATTYVQAHLRDIVGKMELEAVISDIHIINELLRSGLSKVARDWGVEVTKVEIQSIELPQMVLSAMHERKAAEQQKYATEELAQAQAIKIDAIRKAAGRLEDPALQYLYLEALKKVAEGRSSKIIFPLELTHLAERLSGGMPKPQKRELKEELREKYDELLLEETKEGAPISRGDILKTLKRKAKRKLSKN